MSSPRTIIFTYKPSFAIAAAIDELSLLENKERGEMISELLNIGILEKFIELASNSRAAEIYKAYLAAQRPEKRKIKRGNLYRFNIPYGDDQ